MNNARMNIPHFIFVLFGHKNFGEIVTPIQLTSNDFEIILRQVNEIKKET